MTSQSHKLHPVWHSDSTALSHHDLAKPLTTAPQRALTWCLYRQRAPNVTPLGAHQPGDGRRGLCQFGVGLVPTLGDRMADTVSEVLVEQTECDGL